ncbi:hypothetical protein AD954_04940 [Acetobacter cerevisiae]|uniref:Hedgehog/Intein (Hint) domain-containing protein n=1 Tax=Acetobacter cerevisiae TaxID=178900 RepID=A0A149VDH8_9PROT|nr:hypothetical protein AD954_04940 [Acetobacter cerevisiae]
MEVDGGTVIDPITHDYGNVTLNSGTVENLSATGGGITMNGGTLSGGTFLSGATMTVSSGAVSGVATIGNGGHANVSGGTVSDLNIEAGGSGAITGGSVADATVSSGGTLNFDAGAILTDTLTLSNGGTATITGNTGGTVQLGDGYTTGLTITGAGTGSNNTVTTTINGWTSSSQIDLAGVRFDDASYTVSDGTVVVSSDLDDGTKYTVTLDIPGATEDNFKIINDNQGGTILICFLAGSMIRTPTSAVAVEDIQIGDQVVTFDWKNNKDVTRAVVWAGKAHCTVRPELSDDAAGWPVRILKDAIADGVPYKDMLITSEHCLFFEGKFVPARMLVNGVSIFYDKSITSYDYYHVETEQHSVITADGMLTESYLDTGNRSSFSQDGKVVRLGGQKRTWADHAGAPLCVERSFVEPLFRALELRENSVAGCHAPTEKIETTVDPDLHLVTESGAIIRSMRHKGQQYSFMLPPETKSVRLVSRASRPADVIGPFVDDRRSMGVAVADVHLLCAKHTHDITSHLQAEKPEGWYKTDWTDCAWTNGNAVLPLGEYLTNGKIGILSMTIRAAGPYIVEAQKITEAEICSA